MELDIIERPEKTLTDGHIHKFSAASNPVKVVVQRKDNTVVSAEPKAWGEETVVEVEFVFPTRILPTANKSYVYATDSNGNVLLDDVYDVYPIYSVLYGNTVCYRVRLINVLWDEKYTDISDGFVTLFTKEKQDVAVSGFVQADEPHVFQPQRFSFNEYGRAEIYLNAIVKQFFSNRLNIDDTIYCVGQSLGVELNMVTRISFYTLEASIPLDYGLQIVNSVRQLGETKYMEDYAIYT